MRVRRRRRGDWSVKNESGSYAVTHYRECHPNLVMGVQKARGRVERTQRMEEEIPLHLTRISKCIIRFIR
jgi:hypothetical protein